MRKEVVVVTGGTRGIGRKISESFFALGHEVIVNYCGNDDVAEKFFSETGINVMKWDVSNFDECAKAVEKIKQKFGNITVLINNAGVTRDKFLHKMNPQDWEFVLNTNLNSCFNMIRCVIENMRNTKYGRIISISSINAYAGQMGQTNYAASKAGIIGLSKALALESANCGITVNVIAPGYVETEMTAHIKEDMKEKILSQIPLKRFAHAEEVARLVIFIASEKSSYITGAVFDINGAQYMR